MIEFISAASNLFTRACGIDEDIDGISDFLWMAGFDSVVRSSALVVEVELAAGLDVVFEKLVVVLAVAVVLFFCDTITNPLLSSSVPGVPALVT